MPKPYTYEGVLQVRFERRLPVTDEERAQGHTIGSREVSYEPVTVQLEVDVDRLFRTLGDKAARNRGGRSAIAVGVKAKVLARGKRVVQP